LAPVAEAPRRRELTEPAAPDAGAVMGAFRLPGAAVRMTAVAGAWANRVHRLETTAGAYAVKELRNPWGEARFAARLAEAWEVERAAIAAGVPAPEPVPGPGGGPTAAVTCPDGTKARVRVHRWADAAPVGPGPVPLAVARWAGGVLATLHGLGMRPRDRSLFPVPSTAAADVWPRLAQAAREAGAPWAAEFASATPAVETIARLVRAGGHLPGEEVMSHADVDQKNLLLGPDGPLLCDWDVASPVVPRRELADVAFSLARWDDLQVARTLVAAYAAAGGVVPALAPEDLGAPLATSTDWIVLNAEWELGLRAAPAARRRLAHGLLPRLLAELPRQVELAVDVRAALNV
jgi:Ser/Thr protein kinase RdoA (MazF antagonist)